MCSRVDKIEFHILYYTIDQPKHSDKISVPQVKGFKSFGHFKILMSATVQINILNFTIDQAMHFDKASAF